MTTYLKSKTVKPASYFSLLKGKVLLLISLQIFSVGLSAANQSVAAPIPDENVLARLVWSTMLTLDNANRTENYEILHTLGTPEFKRKNSTQALSTLFFSLRQRRVDVGRTILSTPNYYQAPTLNQNGYLRLRGGFDYRPKSIRFDLLYKRMDGGWRIHAISVAEMDSTAPK